MNMNKAQMHATVKILRTDADRALDGGRLKAALLLPKILERLFELVEAIINRLPEEPADGQ